MVVVAQLHFSSERQSVGNGNHIIGFVIVALLSFQELQKQIRCPGIKEKVSPLNDQ